MAQHIVTEIVTDLTDLGYTTEQIAAKIGDTLNKVGGDWVVWNRRSLNAIWDLRETAQEVGSTPAATAAPASGAPLATEKQVAFILRLIRQGAHQEGGFTTGPTDAAGIRKMTRRDASRYIDSLTGRY